jgi:excisionase family DNA binding protein
MATTEPVHELLDIATLAERLHVRIRYIRRLVEEKRIPYIKLGHFIRFDPEEIAIWIRQSRVLPDDDD